MQYNITYRKKDNSWQYIISYKDGLKWKQKSKQGFELSRKGKEFCKDAAEKEVKNLSKKIECDILPEYENITFERYIDLFIEHEKLYKEPNTIESYKRAFKAFKDLNSLQIDKINHTDIQKCVDKLIKTKHAETTVKDYISKLKHSFNCAIKQYKILSSNPVHDIEIKKQKIKKDKIALTKAQLADLLSKIKNPQLYLISLVAAKCGLRISEIMGLTWGDIDTKNCMLSVTKQWKKDKDGNYNFGDLKSKNSKRKVPIPPDLMNGFKNYNSTQKVISINDRIFNYISREALSNALCYIYKQAGYTISVHELRHTYGTMLIANGLDFKTVAKLLGHDVKQTLEIYSHVTDDMMNTAKDLINKIL